MVELIVIDALSMSSPKMFWVLFEKLIIIYMEVEVERRRTWNNILCTCVRILLLSVDKLDGYELF